MNLKKIIFIVGPTGVGKTDVAVFLSQKLNAEIISCDSMQIYKEINIASNKPSEAVLKKVPHHLISEISISMNFNVAAFNRKASKIIKSLHSENRIPIIVGGSGLYVSVLLDGIFEGRSSDKALREQLDQEARKKGELVLYKKLKKCDPAAAEKIHPHDRRRIIRALEVFMVNEKPISQLQKKRNGLWEKFDITVFALNRERPQLYQLINKRVEKMFANGLVDEIKALQGKRWSATAQKLIGVKEVEGYLNGEYDLARAKCFMQMNTRRYAKRQLTWFRKDKRLQWIEPAPGETPAVTASKMFRILNHA